jgi:hypothetical protein
MNLDDPKPIELVREYLKENGIGCGPLFGKTIGSGPSKYFYAQPAKKEIYTIVVWFHVSKPFTISIGDVDFDLHYPDSLQKIVNMIKRDPGPKHFPDEVTCRSKMTSL